MEQTDTQTKPEIKVPCEVYSRIVGYLRPFKTGTRGSNKSSPTARHFKFPKLSKSSDSLDGPQRLGPYFTD